jgi:hypothetical protein
MDPGDECLTEAALTVSAGPHLASEHHPLIGVVGEHYRQEPPDPGQLTRGVVALGRTESQSGRSRCHIRISIPATGLSLLRRPDAHRRLYHRGRPRRAHSHSHLSEPAQPPSIAPARGPPMRDEEFADAVPEWDALPWAGPEHLFDQQSQWCPAHRSCMANGLDRCAGCSRPPRKSGRSLRAMRANGRLSLRFPITRRPPGRPRCLADRRAGRSYPRRPAVPAPRSPPACRRRSYRSRGRHCGRRPRPRDRQ